VSTEIFTRRYAFLTFPEVSVPITTLTYIIIVRVKSTKKQQSWRLFIYATKTKYCFFFFIIFLHVSFFICIFAAKNN